MSTPTIVLDPAVTTIATRFADASVTEALRRCPDLLPPLQSVLWEQAFVDGYKAETHRRSLANCEGCQTWFRRTPAPHTCGDSQVVNR